MPTINIAVNYPIDANARVLAALRAHYGTIEDSPGSNTFRARTPAECEAAFTKSCKDALKDIVVRTEKETARVTAEAGVTDPGVN